MKEKILLVMDVSSREEAMKLVRQEDTRTELAKAPEQVAQVRDLIQQAGLAA